MIGGDFGSYPDGSPRERGLGGADYDRGIQSDRRGLQAERRGERALFRGGGGRIPELGDENPGHRGRGPKGYQRSDARLREDVSDVLADDPHLDASTIEVSVENGEVRLSGRVASRGDKRHAEDLAESVRGVRHVQNDIRVQWMAGGAGATTFGNATSDLSDDGREPVDVEGAPRPAGTSAASGTTGTSGASGRSGRGGTKRNAALPTGRTDDTDSTR
ncbi:BON domain-containing protein [Salinarimonas soli]|uniref:BON domain-containing protein n=1 Tax=Salinarimonas soli TaxID=1638099 RepID=A0A5B2VZM5_9HYPH|nr:BON domain-containing protein [Salinarimonas soli]